MPKYYPYKIFGYYLYYTEHCIIEAMHVHASDSKLSESGSANFFVKADGSTVIKKRGNLKDYRVKPDNDKKRLRFSKTTLQQVTAVLLYAKLQAKAESVDGIVQAEAFAILP